MPTILIKGLQDDVLRELKRMKVELGCKTWAELLAKLVASRRFVVEVDEMRAGVKGFLELRKVVSRKWTGPPGVLEEMRKARGHGEG